jgi:hypothetical protein
MFATELWLTPLILLPGVALLIVSTSARFEQNHNEFHRLLEHPRDHSKIVARNLLVRSALLRNVLVSLYTSVGLFSLGSLLGGVVNVWRPNSLWVVGGLTILGIGCLVYASVQLVRESLLCLQVTRELSRNLERNASVADQTE